MECLSELFEKYKTAHGKFVVVTGVSGSGKSSLVNEILYKTLAKDLNKAKCIPGHCEGVEGEEFLDKVICIDQSPIGRTPRSNPATYTGVFDDNGNKITVTEWFKNEYGDFLKERKIALDKNAIINYLKIDDFFRREVTEKLRFIISSWWIIRCYVSIQHRN